MRAKPLRIVHSEAETSFGGQENRIFKEMLAMREQGHYLEAICQPDAQLTGRLRGDGFVVHTLAMDGVLNILRGIFAIKRILQQGKFDVLNTHSRQDTIIAAPAARLAGTPLLKSRPNLHFVLVGGGSPIYERVVQKVAALGIKNQTHMLGMRKDVPNLLFGMDLFCLATKEEASGTAFVEAAAYGLASVSTNVGGVGEMLLDGVTGLLVPKDDMLGLRRALTRLIDDPALRKKLGQAGCDRVRTEGMFDTQTLSRNTERIYRRWLAELAPLGRA